MFIALISYILIRTRAPVWWEKSFSSSGENNISTWTPADFAHILMFFFFLKIYIGRLMKSLSVLNKEHAIAKVMNLLPLASYRRVMYGLAPQDSLFHTVATIFITGVY